MLSHQTNWIWFISFQIAKNILFLHNPEKLANFTKLHESKEFAAERDLNSAKTNVDDCSNYSLSLWASCWIDQGAMRAQLTTITYRAASWEETTREMGHVLCSPVPDEVDILVMENFTSHQDFNLQY